jgi:hypothetical protein
MKVRIKENDEIDQKYLHDLYSLLNANFRDWGYEKWVYDIYAKRINEKLEQKTKDLNDLANMTSGEGLAVRIASFLGIGGAGLTATGLASFTKGLQLMNTSAIGNFLTLGFIGLIGASIFLKLYASSKIQNNIDRTLKEEQHYWKEHTRPSYKNKLKQLLMMYQLLLRSIILNIMSLTLIVRKES